ncbi:hypothetical protein FKR81_31045 [Lentzea tibetensis]|uniref:Lipoprotein n=1 Tax=Lentzea tibetensis TaxID=2591470 RepID=A0A563EL97_9PSEU|nr:hypothetical protein [Lentzea tibetensis]TWP47778.1 hypothetical protein FKR81_31045 [Lentzea tibetensis]
MRWFVVIAVVLAGCGAQAPPMPEGLAFRTQKLVGMPHPNPAALPEFSLYGDGTVLRPGPAAGALQTAESVHIGQDRAEEFYQDAHDAGLAKNQLIENTHVIDGYAQVFVLNSGGQRFVTTAVNPEDSELLDFQDSLHVDGPATPYRPTKIAAVGWAPDSSQQGRPWPFAALDQRTKEGNCVVLDAAKAETIARETPKGTRWRSGEGSYVVVFRPLLPDESTCADLDV